MWQRIKHFVEKRKSLLSCLCLPNGTSLLVHRLCHLTHRFSHNRYKRPLYHDKSIEQDLYTSAKSVQEYLTQTNRMDTSVFTRSNIQPFVNLQIYDQSGKLIMDNAPAHTMKTLATATLMMRSAVMVPLPFLWAYRATKQTSFPTIRSGVIHKTAPIICAFPEFPTKRMPLYHYCQNNFWLPSSSAWF